MWDLAADAASGEEQERQCHGRAGKTRDPCRLDLTEKDR